MKLGFGSIVFVLAIVAATAVAGCTLCGPSGPGAATPTPTVISNTSANVTATESPSATPSASPEASAVVSEIPPGAVVPTTLPSGLTPTPGPSQLATPEAQGPQDGATMTSTNGYVWFQWQKVPGADQYLVELSQDKAGYFGVYTCFIDPAPIQITQNMQVYWRIQAQDSTGAHQASNFSDWHTFNYIYNPPAATPTPGSQLATPVLLTPSDGVVYTNVNPRVISFTWQAVPGANHYELEEDYYNGNVWVGWSYAGVFNQTFYTEQGFYPGNPGDVAGRWRVTAQNNTGAYQASIPSGWRTFNFTYNPATPTPGYIRLPTPTPAPTYFKPPMHTPTPLPTIRRLP